MSRAAGDKRILEISYGSRRIVFSLEFRARQTIAISVLPDRSVQVIAPCDRSLEQIVERVKRRARWIVRQQRYFADVVETQPQREYRSGETFRYLGRQYLLKVVPVDDRAVTEMRPPFEGVRLHGAFLRVATTEPANRERTRELLNVWYHQHATRKFAERLDACYPLVRRYGIGRPEIVLREMSNRWGSCTKAGRILLNPRLIEAPTHCLDYVLLHELCHLKHLNHGPAFHRLLESVLPEWRHSKERLERVQW